MKTTIPMASIKALHYAKNPDSHWFDHETMKFFKTKLPAYGYKLNARIFFITRETNPDNVSMYSLRELLDNGKIDTVGDFFAYKTMLSAKNALLSLL